MSWRWQYGRILKPVLWIRDVYPGSRILICTHPGSRIQTQQQKRRAKKNLLHTFLWSHKFHKIENYFSFEVLWANFQRIIELFTQKIVTKLSKIWVWDPGSEIPPPPGSGKNLFRIPDPGVKKAPDPGSGSATLLKTQSSANPWKCVRYRFSLDPDLELTVRILPHWPV